MDHAPSVTCPVGRSFLAILIAAVAWLGGVAVAWLWAAQPQAGGWRAGLMWTAVAAAGSIAAWTGWRAPEGTLAWDGAAWTWSCAAAAAAVGRVRPSLDLQHVLLVRWHDGVRGRWFWLERRRCGASWDDVRRAVYSRARPEARPAAVPPAAKS